MSVERADTRRSPEEDEISKSLPVELPALLRGLEGFVAGKAARIADPADRPKYERAVRFVIADLEHRIEGYRALGRVATNDRSLPARLTSSH